MADFVVHTPDSAPAGSRDALQKIVERYGFIPNLAGAFAESPGSMKALLGLLSAYDSPEISLSPVERQVVLLAVSVKNECAYCAAAHSMVGSMSGLSKDEVEALQNGAVLRDAKLQALRRFAEILVEKGGWAGDADVKAFLAAGYTKANVFDVILGVAIKTLTNYANHVAKPPVNAQFAQFLPHWAKTS